MSGTRQMIRGGRVLALIPARAGSERLPGKNIRLLSGLPMISWSIEAAKGSQFVDDVVVSTDDRQIEEIARAAGAEVPFTRPKYLAESTSSMIDVALHALNELEKLGRVYDYVILMQPTSPMRKSKHINEAIELLLEKSANGVISVTKTDHPEEWAREISSDLRMDQFTGPDFCKRSQDFPVRYRVNGAIYLLRSAYLRKEKTFFLKSNCVALLMNPEESIDVDSWLQFRVAQMLLEGGREHVLGRR